MGQQARTRRERREMMRREAKMHAQHQTHSVPLLPLLAIVALLLVGGLLIANGGFFSSRSADTASQMNTMSTSNTAGALLGTSVARLTRAVPSTLGRTVSLADYRGKKLVVFLYEGATCGSCQQQLIQLQQDLASIRRAGGDVVAVSTDAADQSRSVADQLHLQYPILADTNHRIGSAFRDFHLVTTAMDMGPVDNHAIFLVDGKGIVRWKSMATDTMWVDPSKLLAAVRQA